MSSTFPRCSTFLHFPLLSEYIMEPLQFGLWIFSRGNVKRKKIEIKKRESKKNKRAKAESGARWLYSAARDEGNAPVAATVHRGGWNTAAESGNPLTSVPFMLLSPKASTIRYSHPARLIRHGCQALEDACTRWPQCRPLGVTCYRLLQHGRAKGTPHFLCLPSGIDSEADVS